MVTTAAGASIDPALVLALSREERFREEIYEENPVGVFRGLAFAAIFYLILALTGAAGWELWRVLR
jgi:Mg/Co/Ni transporter MgtE